LNSYVPWFVERGIGPLLSVAPHDGHEVRGDLLDVMKLSDSGRLREEDPYTGDWTCVAPNRVVVSQSRFECDLNRPRDRAVYQVPSDAWGLDVWKSPLAKSEVAKSLALYDAFYQEVEILLRNLVARYERVVVFDIHTYNAKRNGPDSDVDTTAHPEINIGTGTLDRKFWSPIIDRFIVDLRNYDFAGRHLDVRENIVFRGGNFAQWAHSMFPESVCVISIEARKFFMDEWTGELDVSLHDNLTRAFKSTIWGVYEELANMKHTPFDVEVNR
jgi:N-formylglutamate deformylase